MTTGCRWHTRASPLSSDGTRALAPSCCWAFLLVLWCASHVFPRWKWWKLSENDENYKKTLEKNTVDSYHFIFRINIIKFAKSRIDLLNSNAIPEYHVTVLSYISHSFWRLWTRVVWRLYMDIYIYLYVGSGQKPLVKKHRSRCETNCVR